MLITYSPQWLLLNIYTFHKWSSATFIECFCFWFLVPRCHFSILFYKFSLRLCPCCHYLRLYSVRQHFAPNMAEFMACSEMEFDLFLNIYAPIFFDYTCCPNYRSIKLHPWLYLFQPNFRSKNQSILSLTLEKHVRPVQNGICSKIEISLGFPCWC